jgi:carbamoyl-phosphate synthase small subunit
MMRLTVVREALLVLEDGAVFRGQAFGAVGETHGEVVFNTGMTGYQEVLTDPSYHGQIVVMAAPHIGNVGINADDDEAGRPWVAGFVLREASPIVSNWRSSQALDDYMRQHGIVSMAGCPTRALVRHIRSRGAMRAVLSSVENDPQALHQRALAAPSMHGADLARDVTCAAPYTWASPADLAWYHGGLPQWRAAPPRRIVAYDFGIKRNILRLLTAYGFETTVVSATTPAAEVLALRPDGVFLSNGPGDPAAVTYAIDALRQLLGRVPIFGICLGHQLLGLALGGRTYKLKFGHRGINQPVKNVLTGRVEITTHNHGFAVEADSLPAGVEITHLNLNDGCVEGLRQIELGAFSVQFHPEAGAGPHDAVALFGEFRRLVEERRR